MRTPSVLLFCLAACGDASDPAPTATGAPAAKKTEAKAPPPPPPTGGLPADLTVPEKDPVSLPAGVPNTATPPIKLLGFGISLTLHPPFQGAKLGENLQSGNPDAMVVSWWDVNAEKAGVAGRAGLHNSTIVPVATTAADAEIRPGTWMNRKKTIHTLEFGEGGTVLRMPYGYNALGGFGTLENGPTHAEWKMQVGDAAPIPWPEEKGLMLHSWDPADGGPLKWQKMPVRPWGPWVEPEKAAAPEKAAEPAEKAGEPEKAAEPEKAGEPDKAGEPEKAP